MNPPRAYGVLLRLYPRDYRLKFAPEMRNAFERTAEEARLQCWPPFLRFLLAEFTGLLVGAGAEWIAKWTTDSSARGRSLPDLRMMRPPGVPREVWFAGTYPNTRCRLRGRLQGRSNLEDSGT